MPPQIFNILLLGPTGSGKSTFINAIANYFTYENLAEALNINKPVCLIPTYTVITKYDDDFVITEMTASKFPVNSVDADNECLNYGSSATMKPLVHSFYNEQIRFNIIDVPGQGSTFGIFRDIKNKKLITAELKKFKKIHGILIILNGIIYRLTDELKYDFGEIFLLLADDVIPNIFFVFTHSRGFDYGHGNALFQVKQYFNELKKKTGKHIALNKSNVFCIDSESYKFQCLWEKSKEYRKEMSPLKSSYEQSWNISRKATINILEQIIIHESQDKRPPISDIIYGNTQYNISAVRLLIHEKSNSLPKLTTLLNLIQQETILPKRQNFISDLLKLNDAIQSENHKTLSESIFKFQEYGEINWIVSDNSIQVLHGSNTLLKNMPIFSIRPQESDTYNYNCFNRRISLNRKPKANQAIINIIAVQMTNAISEQFLNFLKDSMGKEILFTKFALFLLSNYLQQNAILLYNENFEKRNALEMRMENAYLNDSKTEEEIERCRSNINKLENLLHSHKIEIATILTSLQNENCAEKIAQNEVNKTHFVRK